MFRSSSFMDLEAANGSQLWSNNIDPIEYAFWPREHRVVEAVRAWTTGVFPWVAILLFLVGFIPFSHLLFLLLSLLCILACLRTLALTALVQRLQYLQQQDGVGGSPATEEGSPRTAPSTRVLLFDTISASLLNLRLSLIDRDFTAADYEALLGLDATRTRVPVTDAQLASLHHFKYSTMEKKGCGGGQDLCSICLEQYREGSMVTQLQCNHSFHSTCINTWLRQQGARSTCPVCKGQVFSEAPRGAPTGADQMRIS